jgi:hypothetical protein
MPEGYLAPTPPAKNLASDPLIRLVTYTLEDPTPAEIIAFAKNKKVDRIVSVAIYVHPNGTQMQQFGEVQGLGGVWSHQHAATVHAKGITPSHLLRG